LRSALLVHFQALDDSRVAPPLDQAMLDIIAITIGAAICSSDGWVEVEGFGQAKRGWLKTFLRPPYGLPSHDTFGRVFVRLTPQQLAACFAAWQFPC
jgi:hypothetical protein